MRNVKMTANRKFIEDVIELHEKGKSVEEIMFSLNLVFEEEVEETENRKHETAIEERHNLEHEPEPFMDYNDLD